MQEIYDYTEAGFRTFALWGINNDGGCECGDADCNAVGKHPRVSSWQYSPVWSDEQLDAMVEHTITTGFGVLADGCLIIDIDRRNGGFESYEKLKKDTGTDYEALSGYVVATGGGGLHIYFKAPAGVALKTKSDTYPGIDFKSSGYVVGCGSVHASGVVYERKKGYPSDLTDAPDALVNVLKKPDLIRAELSGGSIDISESDLVSMLNFIDPDCDYDEWIKCGMAVHHATQGLGDSIWSDWSAKGKKWAGASAIERHWHSFGKSANPVTIGTLIHYAEAAGYVAPVTFSMGDDDIKKPVPHLLDGGGVESLTHPFPIDTVDLLRPVGFVGKVVEWINAQCLHPREHLASIAGIYAVANCLGLRYTDEYNTRSNLFTFSVAGSATGKEAIQQAIAAIHRAAGIQSAMHGTIKSEQEIVRNIVRNQAAFYVIDEIGIFLQKVANSNRAGGAVYLQGVIGELMKIYSKADGFYLLTGDTKEEQRKILAQELAQCRKLVSENEDADGTAQRRIPQLIEGLSQIDDGLKEPFMSLSGFTTPVTFDSLVTYEQATNGFIGRSIIAIEKETNPKAKRGFKKIDMAEGMRGTLQRLYAGGVYDSKQTRVEYYGPRAVIKTTGEAREMLQKVSDFFYEYSEQQKGETGLEAITRRAYEMVLKVSLVLGVPEGIRTADHVRWAYALVRRDVDMKINLAMSNIMQESKNSDEKGKALIARILNQVDPEHGETVAVLINKNRSYNRGQVTDCINHMVEKGLVKKVELKHRETGKVFEKVFGI